MPGDWICRNCGYNNFARRHVNYLFY
jgi:hypothetical protein